VLAVKYRTVKFNISAIISAVRRLRASVFPAEGYIVLCRRPSGRRPTSSQSDAARLHLGCLPPCAGHMRSGSLPSRQHQLFVWPSERYSDD